MNTTKRYNRRPFRKIILHPYANKFYKSPNSMYFSINFVCQFTSSKLTTATSDSPERWTRGSQKIFFLVECVYRF